jgi:uncharacterized membrane protein YidH (DUF202 family)
MAPIARAPRRYFIEFNGAMLLYLAAVLGRVYAAPLVSDPTLKTLVILSPILPVFLAAFAALRFYRGIDEYHRLQILESLAIATGAAGVITISWSFLEDVGFPHLSISYAWPIIAAVWGIVALYFGWKDKVSEGRTWQTLKSVAATLIYVGVGTVVYALVGGWAGLPTPWYILALVASVLFIGRMGFFIFSKTSKQC